MDGSFDQVTENVGVTIDTLAMPAGLHTLFLRARNSEGHWGAPREHKFEVLQPPIISSAEYYVDTDPGVGNGTAMNAEDGSFNSTVEMLLKTFNTSSLSNGTHTLYVRAKDSNQRWGASQSTTFLNSYLLSVARNGNGSGSVTSGDSPRGINCGSDCTEIYNSQSVTLTAVADPGSTFISWVGCTTVSDNTCTVLMTADKWVTALINDITPPDTAIGSKPNTLTNSASASFTFTSTETNSNFECRIDNDAYSACTSPKTYANLVDGNRTFDVRAKDAAGNTDATPATYTWMVDLTPPDTTIGSKPNTRTNSTGPSFSFTATEVNSTFECKLDNGVFAACTTPKGYNSLTDGSHIFTVRATDTAGNTNTTPTSYTWTIDTTAPALAVTDPNMDITTRQGSYTIHGTVTDALTAVTINISVDGQTFTSPVTNESFSQSIFFTASKSYAITVTATDEVGNQTSVQRNIIYKNAGDCDNSGTVTIDEVQSAINMFLQIKSVDGCVDTNGDGMVSISEVQKVINEFLGM